MTDGVAVLGIRHHGPGSARSVVRALERLRPDLVLVEGPPDAQALIPLAVAPGMRPPVALAVYPAQRPGAGVFYPFATFSPEWNAIHYALRHQIPVRFCDLPQSMSLTDRQRELTTDEEPADPTRLRAQTAGQPTRGRWG